MSLLRDELLRLEQRYFTILEKANRTLERPIEGRLEVTSQHGHPIYRFVEKDPETHQLMKTYLHQPDSERIRMLAQQQYAKKMRGLMVKRLKQIRHFLDEWQHDEVQKIFEHTPTTRQCLIRPYTLTLEQWMELPYSGLPFQHDDVFIQTQTGVRVRSKSEKILGDLFTDLGLRYKYECPLTLSDGHIYYPDFTFFNPNSQTEIYWEHLGMMDDSGYCQRALSKIRNYEKQGIWRGHQLILTFETSMQPLDVPWARRLAQELVRALS